MFPRGPAGSVIKPPSTNLNMPGYYSARCATYTVMVCGEYAGQIVSVLVVRRSLPRIKLPPLLYAYRLLHRTLIEDDRFQVSSCCLRVRKLVPCPRWLFPMYLRSLPVFWGRSGVPTRLRDWFRGYLGCLAVLPNPARGSA